MAALGAINPEKSGLTYWADRVLKKHVELGGHLPARPVHDLRVALRRCILIADLMKELDPGDDWKAMRKAGRKLFRQIGALRDTQVLIDRLEHLAAPGEPAVAGLLETLNAQYKIDTAAAHQAAKNFDAKQWRVETKRLTRSFLHLASDRPACEALALEAWQAVRDGHRRAQKNRSRIGYHRLRVKLKKFRYTIENFLPAMYPVWAPELKLLQDLLGEVHDLDVLEQTIAKNKSQFDPATLGQWTEKLESERAARLQLFRAKMAGKSSPLCIWREGLPADGKQRSTGLARLAAWAYFVTPDFPHVRKVARFALQIHDGLANCGLAPAESEFGGRAVLQAAALLQDVGRFRKRKAYHKESYRMIREVPPPVGWSARDLDVVALVARFHRGALPHIDRKVFEAYPLPVRESLIFLAATLRLANAFSCKTCMGVRHLEIEKRSGVIIVRPAGLKEIEPLGSKLSVAVRLMESACGHRVNILAHGQQIMAPQLVRRAASSDAA